MFYPFPHATHIDDFLPAIAGRDEFIVKRDEKSGIAIINYIFATETSFPDPFSFDAPAEQRLAALRRECRGIKFDLATGRIVTRPYSKFHNVNERPDYAASAIDWTQPHHILFKLDGSMVTGYRHPEGHFEWHTKMGHTEVALPVERFVAASSLPYETFSQEWMDRDYTTIYEWCSLSQRIVIAYPVENLVLTGIRHNFTGQYVPYPLMAKAATLAGIPVVEALDSQVDDIVAFLAEIAALKGAEGVVVRFDDGSMVKIKAEEYVLMHRTKDNFSSEKNLWNLVLGDALDDAKAFMLDDDRAMVEAFAEAFDNGVLTTANSLEAVVRAARVVHGDDKKQFAMNIKNWTRNSDWDRGLLFSIWDGGNAVEAVLKLLRKNTGSQPKIDAIRCMVGGVRWTDFYKSSADSEYLTTDWS